VFRQNSRRLETKLSDRVSHVFAPDERHTVRHSQLVRQRGHLAVAVVEHVVGVRDSLRLSSRLREMDGVSRGRVPAVAEAIHDDGLMSVAPERGRPDDRRDRRCSRDRVVKR
jgi:hypothetical protein